MESVPYASNLYELDRQVRYFRQRAQYCRARSSTDALAESSRQFGEAMLLALREAERCRGRLAPSKVNGLLDLVQLYRNRIEDMNHSMRSLADNYSQLESDYASLREYLTRDRRDFSLGYTPIPTAFPEGADVPSEEGYARALASQTTPLRESVVSESGESSESGGEGEAGMSPSHLPPLYSAEGQPLSSRTPSSESSSSPQPESSLAGTDGIAMQSESGVPGELFLSGPSDFTFTNSLPLESSIAAAPRGRRVLSYDDRKARVFHIVELNDANIVQPEDDSRDSEEEADDA